jgi:hypothetical protein
VAKSRTLQPFVVAPDDPFAAEHAVVAGWVEDVAEMLGEYRYWEALELKTRPSGALLLAGTPEQSRKYALAAVAQTRHWDRQADAIRDSAKSEMERMNAHHLPGYTLVWVRRRHAELVVRTLLKRNLPFDKDDLLLLLEWCGDCDRLSPFDCSVGGITRAVQRYATGHELEADLGESIRKVADRIRTTHYKELHRYGTELELLCGRGEPEAVPASDRPVQPPPVPAPAGSAHAFLALKRAFGMLPAEPLPAVTIIGPDRFPLPDNSPLNIEHGLLTALFEEVIGTRDYYEPKLAELCTGRKLIEGTLEETGQVLIAAAERHFNTLLPSTVSTDDGTHWQSHYAAAGVASNLLRREFDVDRRGVFDLLLYVSVLPPYLRDGIDETTSRLMNAAERSDEESPLTEGERFVLSLFRASLITGPLLGSLTGLTGRLTAMIGDRASYQLVPGEVWSDAVNTEVSSYDEPDRSRWSALFRHALTATSSRPSGKWLKTAGQLVEAIGGQRVHTALSGWFPLVSQGRSIRKFGAYTGDTRGASDTMIGPNADCLRGLLWCVPLLPDRDELARTVTAVAISAYKKVPGVGPRAVKVGNAAVYCLSELGSRDAVGHLAMLKLRVKFGTAQKEIEKAFDAAATALGMPRDQIEELGVPSYGLEEVGRLSETLGSYRADLLVNGSHATLSWFDSNGKSLKSVPAKVKQEHPEELKDLQTSLKDMQAMLPAQRDRIDGMFLLAKNWSISEWRQRYLDHPLVGTIARRLLWCVDGTAALFVEGVPQDLQGRPISHGKTAEITLWHPVGRSIDEITAWRRRLEEAGITQPFKQAHREVYLLTDAERNTRTYSNRFAAHVIRQHQFNALCAARGWKNQLRLMVDAEYSPPTRILPQWGLRAEYWVEGIGENPGIDTNDAGVFLRLATDQVRFYRTGAATNRVHTGGGQYTSAAAGPGEANINEPIPLEEVPPLVLSEVLRDVDLFVGVASVGNDPAWQDGGPDGRYREYWHSYSFGELAGTATTRKQVLERLIPRLKIAARCSFVDRFLVVRGDQRTYKIHLGSGNILMEPNDQYLCIVPDARTRAAGGDLYLPFEGDSILSVILSKALLLADDTKISDPSITRQINTK